MVGNGGEWWGNIVMGSVINVMDYILIKYLFIPGTAINVRDVDAYNGRTIATANDNEQHDIK